MRIVKRVIVVCCLLSFWSLGSFQLPPKPAFAQYIQRKYSGKHSNDLPLYVLDRSLPSSLLLNGVERGFSLPLRQFKLWFIPVQVLGEHPKMPKILKKAPQVSRAFNRRKLLLKEQVKKVHTGIVAELESAYGINNTIIGRIQHGTQFKGANYFMWGHWERTDGEDGDHNEENITTRMKVDWAISKNSTASLDSSYFQSHIALPQLREDQQHKKSAIQLIAGMRVNIDPDTDVEIALSGEQARFSDQDRLTFEMNSYGGQLNLKQLWSPKNTLEFHSKGYWEEYFQEDEHFETRYYGTGTLLNTLVIHDKFALDTGVQFDYYHSKDLPDTDYFVAPIVTTRLSLFRNTILYATYRPRLKIPRFTDLYIQKLYTSVNPNLHPEKILHYAEIGINQKFADAVSMNMGFFYQETDDVILQIDENSDNILEYTQLIGTYRFMGVKANLQMNYLEQFVQSITYTYTNYDQFSQQYGIERIFTYQPNHQVQASFYWDTPFGLAVDVSGTYISEQFRNIREEQNLIGKRFFINVVLTQKITKNFQIFLLGRNLTDTNTYDIIPLLDSEEITSSRLFIGGLRFRF